MGSKLNYIIEKELIKSHQFPSWLQKATQYEVISGSISYGISNDTSDMDIVGFCIPRKDIVFPHLGGVIYGFDQWNNFEQWQLHHVKDIEHRAGKTDEYDFTIYGIVRYFSLCMQNNPNMLDSLFAPQDCVLHITPVGGLVRSHRRDFLHKGSFHKFRGYLHAQMAKLSRKPEGKRAESFEKLGFDSKYAAHAVRLTDECEQILEFGDLDLRRAKEHLKAIRSGNIPLEDIKKFLFEKERHLGNLYEKSSLPIRPDKNKIKQLLLNCLEQHFGSLTEAEIVNPDKNKNILNQIRELVKE